MEIRGFACRKCGSPLRDDFPVCPACRFPYSPILQVVREEHYGLRIRMINSWLKTHKGESVGITLFLSALSESLAMILRAKVPLNEKTIRSIFQHCEELTQ